jgi:hydrogenase nickel incorporation protein HypA/HybF
VHELSLCESIVELAEEKALTQKYKRVRTIRLEIGKLSCVEIEAMRFAFDAVAKNSVAEGAQLLIDVIPGKAWCSRCEAEVEVNQRYDGCPFCEFVPLEIRDGDAMRIKDMEVE